MASEVIVKAVRRTLKAFDQGFLSEQETVVKLGHILGDDEIGAVLPEIPEEKHTLVRAGYEVAMKIVVDGDCLEPEQSPFSGMFSERERQLSETLLESRDRDWPTPRFFVVCVPSFSPCWALRLVRGVKRGKVACGPMLVVIQGERAGDPRMRWEVVVTEELAARLQRMWDTMLKTTRAHRHPRAGLDGIEYHFAAGWSAGRTWAPPAASRVGRFTQFAHTLAQYVAASTENRPALEDALRIELEWFKV